MHQSFYTSLDWLISCHPACAFSLLEFREEARSSTAVASLFSERKRTNSFRAAHIQPRKDMSARETILDSVFSLLLAMDLTGNALVVIVIIRNETMKTAMNFLLLNLAVADILVGLFFAPSFLLMPMVAHPKGLPGDVLCKIITGKNIAWLSSLASGFTLVLVSVERFFVIRYPLEEHKIDKKKLAFLLPIVWLLAFALTLPSFLADRFDEGQCSEAMERGDWQNIVYAFVWLIFGGVVPVGIMSSLYSIIVNIFRSSAIDTAIAAVLKSRKKVSVMVIIISLTYALCVLPTHIFYCVYAFNRSRFSGDLTIFPITYILLVLNSTLNPVVYIFQCAEFRKCLRKLLCCKEGESGLFLDETLENSPAIRGVSVAEAEDVV